MATLHSQSNCDVYVVVQFYPWFIFYSPSFFYVNIMILSIKQKKKIEPRIKLNYNIYAVLEVFSQAKNEVSHSKSEENSY